MAFARYETSTFYLAAAVICLLPVVYALFRHKSCRNKTLNGD